MRIHYALVPTIWYRSCYYFIIIRIYNVVRTYIICNHIQSYNIYCSAVKKNISIVCTRTISAIPNNEKRVYSFFHPETIPLTMQVNVTWYIYFSTTDQRYTRFPTNTRVWINYVYKYKSESIMFFFPNWTRPSQFFSVIEFNRTLIIAVYLWSIITISMAEINVWYLYV